MERKRRLRYFQCQRKGCTRLTIEESKLCPECERELTNLEENNVDKIKHKLKAMRGEK